MKEESWGQHLHQQCFRKPVTKRSILTMDDIADRQDVDKADEKRAEEEYGTHIDYADEENKKYPLNTKEHVEAAVKYWGMPKNHDKYSPGDRAKIEAKIRAAAKKFGVNAPSVAKK